jgi:hypothetical protein
MPMIFRLAALSAIVCVISACGVRNDPQLPEGLSDDFPRTYPQGATPPESVDSLFRRRGTPQRI